jgi:hypothetical protein
MAPDRPEPFHPEPFRLALLALRERLRAGRYASGARIRATTLAEELRLSPTPVREALARLAGEGLVEDRRRIGYFVPVLSGRDVADLYGLSLAHLELALWPGRTARPPPAGRSVGPGADPVAAVEQLFLGLVLEAGGRALAASYRPLAAKLGAVRRAEPLVFADLAEEAAGLDAVARNAAVAGPKGLRAAVADFHARRQAEAERLASLVEPPAGAGEE